MGIVKLLLQKEALVFRNTYHLKTATQILVVLLVPIIALVIMGGITGAFAVMLSRLLGDPPPGLEALLITPLFHTVLGVFLFTSFLFILREAPPKLYDSPELSLLISSPIPANTLYLFRFILITCSSKPVMIKLFLAILPFLIGLGIAAAAPWYYYLFVLLVAYSLLIISTSFAVVVMLLLVRVFSAKRLAQVTAVVSFLGIALWLGFIFFAPRILRPEMVVQLLEWVMELGVLWYIMFAVSDAAALLSGLIQGEIALWPLTRLFVVTGVILGGSMLVARRVYYQAYDRSQMVEISTKKQVKQPVREHLSLGRRSNLILTEWKKAMRNYEMARAAIGLLVMLGFYLFMRGGAAPPEPWGSLVMLGHVGVIGFLASYGVLAFFFTPGALKEDPKALKEQFLVLKSAPFAGRDFIFSYWLAPFIPQIFLSTVILLVLNIFLGSSIPFILLSLVVLALVVGSAGAFYWGWYLARMEGKGWVTSLGFLGDCLPILYYILAIGILALGLAYTEIGFLGFLHHLPQGLMIAITSAAFLALVGYTFYHSFRLGAKYWEEMEV